MTKSKNHPPAESSSKRKEEEQRSIDDTCSVFGIVGRVLEIQERRRSKTRETMDSLLSMASSFQSLRYTHPAQKICAAESSNGYPPEKAKGNSKEDARASQVQQSVAALQKRQEEDNLAFVAPEWKTYRIEALRQCYKEILERFKGFVDQHSGSGLSIVGCAKDLPRTIGPVLLIAEMKRLRAITLDPAIATIYDGTPAGTEIEAVKAWMVWRKDYKIIELLVRIKLYGKKLIGKIYWILCLVLVNLKDSPPDAYIRWNS
jgi:hypothetical protein